MIKASGLQGWSQQDMDGCLDMRRQLQQAQMMQSRRFCPKPLTAHLTPDLPYIMRTCLGKGRQGFHCQLRPEQECAGVH